MRFRSWLVACALGVAQSLDTYRLDLHRCRTPSSPWTVRGFRNMATRGNCTSGKPFDAAALGPLRSSLLSVWPGCPSSSSDAVWSAAWHRDGRCSSLSEAEYFNTSLALARHNLKYCARSG